MAEEARAGRGRAGRGRLAILLVGVLLAAAGCAVSGSPGLSGSAAGLGSGVVPSSSEGPISPVVGTVASVDPAAPASPAATPKKATAKPSAKPPAKTAQPTASPAGAQPLGFTLLTTGGETLTFTIGELDNADEFPPEDLYDRISSGDPIRVLFTVEGDTLLVYHIEDAG